MLDIPDPVFPENPEQGGPAYTYQPDSPYPGYYDNPEVWFPILDTPTDDLDLKAHVLGLRSGDDALAVAIDAIVTDGPRVFAVGGATILVAPNGTAGARAYDAAGTELAEGDQPDVDTTTDQAVLADGTVLPAPHRRPRVLVRLVRQQPRNRLVATKQLKSGCGAQRQVSSRRRGDQVSMPSRSASSGQKTPTAASTTVNNSSSLSSLSVVSIACRRKSSYSA